MSNKPTADQTMRAFKFAARRAGCKKRGRDGTKYSLTPPTSFLTHHMRQISSPGLLRGDHFGAARVMSD